MPWYSHDAARGMRQNNMVICPAGTGTQNDYAGEAEQQFADRQQKG
jgi:hypothetical protein